VIEELFVNIIVINVKNIVYLNTQLILKETHLILEKDIKEFIEMKLLSKLCKNGWN
jgi:hypothetical protein